MLRAGQATEGEATGETQNPSQALEDLCKMYWYPVYAFARRQGQTAEDAQDLVQAFFLDLLERNSFAVADPERGRFRNFLLTSFLNFHSKQREYGRALKRGGGKTVLSFETELAEQRFGLAAESNCTPEQQFLREWTLDLLDQALLELGKEYIARAQGELFEALKDYLAEATPPPYEEIAQQLGKSVGSVRVALHRVRGRYRSAVRAAIAHTLPHECADEVDRELEELMQALSCTGV